MSELLTASQMRAIENAAIESGQVSGLELMERAGQGVVEAIFEEWPEYRSAPQTASIFCGPGNNGGDGFVVARLLHLAGWQVQVWFYGDAAGLSADARANHDQWLALGEIYPLENTAFRQSPDADLYVDAIFGTGLSRAPSGDLGEFLAYLGGSCGDCGHFQPRLVAIDAPSGLCLDSGRLLGGGDPSPFSSTVPLCRLTVCFDSPKVGHVIADGPAACGKLVVKDIGIAKWRQVERPKGAGFGAMRAPQTVLLCRDLMVPDTRPFLGQITLFGKGAEGHKFSHGHALILSGGAGKTGAARLAARGALRIGAGVVTLGVPPAAQQEVACQITALMLRRVKDGAALGEILRDQRFNALCLGPGLGVDEHARDLVAVALQSLRPTVLDADALTLLARDADLRNMLHDKCVLTPHAGEFSRLFPELTAQLQAQPTGGPAYSKVDATRAAAAHLGCVVLFKGADTVIGAPSMPCGVNACCYDQAAPWLATAGSGDVLAGFITGLLARGLPPFLAAQNAAWLHAQAAREFGPGLIAEDLPEILPQVFREMGL